MLRETRRTFLMTSASLVAASSAKGFYANNTLNVGVMGMGGRGSELSREFGGCENVNVTYVCDPDTQRAESAAAALEKKFGSKPRVVADFRKMLDDKTLDIMICAACNHWHAPATIAACNAGKHVYVEKPCSHNPKEGELMVAAAAKHKRQVQMGNQRRSWPKVQEAIAFLREGGIGKVYFAESWYTANRGSIGKGTKGPPPADLDFDLWQGPAPRTDYRNNILHYNWHWFWHWGNGELGNNGVHMIDVCRWGLGKAFPIGVRSTGGRYRFDDDQETPDTHIAAYDFGDASLAWHGTSCSQFPGGGAPADVLFHGEKGTLAIKGGGYSVHDPKGKEFKKVAGKGGNREHIDNFLAACRENGTLNSPISEGHISTLLCHLGNIAHRVNRSLATDSTNGAIINDEVATKNYWSREYAPGWEPKVT